MWLYKHVCRVDVFLNAFWPYNYQFVVEFPSVDDCIENHVMDYAPNTNHVITCVVLIMNPLSSLVHVGKSKVDLVYRMLAGYFVFPSY